MNKSLGLVIKQFRKALNKTQKEISVKTKLSQNTISNHESGNRSIGISDLNRYSNALTIHGVTLPSSMFLKIANELETKGESEILNNIKLFFAVIKYVKQAVESDNNISNNSHDLISEAEEVFRVILHTKYNDITLEYETVLDYYKQILSKKNIDENEENDISDEISNFMQSYFQLLSIKPDTKIKIKEDIKKTISLEKKSLQIGEKLKSVPNYAYDIISGKPLYKPYLEHYPKELRELREYLLELLTKED